MYARPLTPLRLARIQQALTQLAVAQRAGIAASRLSVLECGYAPPNERERAALAGVLGVPAEQLFRETGALVGSLAASTCGTTPPPGSEGRGV